MDYCVPLKWTVGPLDAIFEVNICGSCRWSWTDRKHATMVHIRQLRCVRPYLKFTDFNSWLSRGKGWGTTITSCRRNVCNSTNPWLRESY